MSPLLRRAVLLALAYAAGPAFAGEETAPSAAVTTAQATAAAAPASAAAPDSVPAAATPPDPPPLVQLPILAPEPATQPPATGTTVAPELAPPPATEAAATPIEPAAPGAFAPARPIPAMTTGNELFKRLRGDLNPNACDAGRNSARWRERYAGHPAAFSRRVQSVLPLIDFVSVEVERAGLPAEFTFIPLVESWYNPGAIGPGGPAGMWQMIASTAKNHGIHIREGYDGRLSPVESTRAALSYLRVLKDMFGGDWQAIVMAYNAGEGRMQNAFRRAGSRRTNASERRPHGLSNITYDYVDKLQALSCLVLQPQRFGLHLPVEARYEPLVPLLMDPGIDSLEEFARVRGKDAQQLRQLNPGFRNGRVVAGVPRLVLSPPGASVAPVEATQAPQVLLASAETDDSEFAELIEVALLQEDPAASLLAEPAPAPAAAKQDTPAIADAAEPATPMLAVVDSRPTAVEVANAGFGQPPAPPVHEVKPGESLSSIAQHYHMPVEQLRRANKLDGKATLHPGQLLQLLP